jgi:tetratricopeptide (TPR) repeat protein
MDLIAGSNPSINQNATGPGDNVAGDKNVAIYQRLAPEALRKPIELILSSVRERKPNIAKIQLEVLKSTELDSNSEAILDMLSIQLNLLEDNEKPRVHSSLRSTFKNSTDSVFRDLCLATLIRLDAKNDQVDDARERYLRADTPLSYSQEAFYEFVATSDELEQAYKEKRIDLDESQLNGLIRGALRTQKFELSLTTANRLNKIFPSFNSKVLLIIATACNLQIKLVNKHFWTITARLKAEIIKLINEVVFLINESKGADSRLFNIAALYLDYTLYEHQALSDICWKHVDEIEKNHPAIAARLHASYGNDISKIKDEVDYRYIKAQKDKSYRTELLSELFTKKELSSVDFAIFSRFSDSNKLKQWVHSGGTVMGREEIETDFYQLELLLALLDETRPEAINQIEKIRCHLEKIIEKHKGKLAQLDPVALLELTERLLSYPKLSVFVCELINPLLPISDLWVSPIVESYLNALLSSQQMATLASVLSNIDQTEWNSFVWRVQAHQFEQRHDYPNAIQAIEEALKLDSGLLDAWYFLSYLYRKLKISDCDLALILKDIPDEVLSRKSDMVVNLLIEIAKTGDFVRSEKILLLWFIENPSACATEITNFNFNLTFAHVEAEPTLEKVGDCVVGVRFKKDNEELTRLLVDQVTVNHHCLLDVNSGLGNALYQMKVGETKQQGMNDLTMLERLSPYVAAFQISLDLRDTQNNGSDCFFALKAPDDPSELLALLERKLPRNRNNDIFNNSKIPLACKGHILDRHNPVKAAFEQLLTKKSLQCFLPNFGEEEACEIILDVYAITYLAITGLAYGINHTSINFVITQETKLVIEHWFTEGYLPISARNNVGMWRQSPDDINQYAQSIEKALRLIINNAEVIKPNLVDVPPFMLSIQDIVDISVYSSVCLSVSNNVPWLCIDEILAHYIKESGCKQANSVKLFIELGNWVTFEQKKDGLYLYAEQIIPYALSYNDLILLSISYDEHAHYFLAKILYLHPKAFSDTESAVAMLTELLIPVLRKAYLDGNILKGLRIHNPTNNGYTEKVFNTCCYLSMQCNDGDIAERKLAKLLSRLFVRFSGIPPMIQVLQAMASEFRTGHFMDFPIINACIKEELRILINLNSDSGRT